MIFVISTIDDTSDVALAPHQDPIGQVAGKVDVRLPEKNIELPWREAGPPRHHDDKMDSDQEVFNKNSFSMGKSTRKRAA